MKEEMIIFAGRSHPMLAATIAKHLNTTLGQSEVVTFSNENIMVRIKDNVREKDVFVIQTSFSPVHDNIMELLIFLDALKYASAGRITAVIPYFPYARSDKKDEPRISITARLMADLIENAGANRVLTMDLHAPQIQGFFRIPVDQLLCAPIFFQYFKETLFKEYSKEDMVLVMPDIGGAKKYSYYFDELNEMPVVIMDKVRVGHTNELIMKMIQGNCEGKIALIVDDEIASGSTIIEAYKVLKENGAEKVMVVAVHPVFSGNAIEKVMETDIEKIIVGNTVPIEERFEAYLDKCAQSMRNQGRDEEEIRRILNEKRSRFVIKDTAPMFARAIQAIHNGYPMVELFPPSVKRKLR